MRDAWNKDWRHQRGPEREGGPGNLGSSRSDREESLLQQRDIELRDATFAAEEAEIAGRKPLCCRPTRAEPVNLIPSTSRPAAVVRRAVAEDQRTQEDARPRQSVRLDSQNHEQVHCCLDRRFPSGLRCWRSGDGDADVWVSQ